MSIANELVGLSDRFMCWQTCFFSFKYIPGNGGQDVVKGESFCFHRLTFSLSCRVGEYLTEGFDPGSE